MELFMDQIQKQGRFLLLIVTVQIVIVSITKLFIERKEAV